MAETLEFNDIFQEVKGSMVRMAWAFNKGREREEFVSINKSLTLTTTLETVYLVFFRLKTAATSKSY